MPAISRAAVAVGADGLIVEVHPCPEKAVSDGAQSLTVPQFRSMMHELKPYISLWKEGRAREVATVLGASRVLADPGAIGFGCQRE